jgi:hypothetical protein
MSYQINISLSLAVPPGLAESPLPTHCVPTYASFVNEVFSPSPILRICIPFLSPSGVHSAPPPHAALSPPAARSYASIEAYSLSISGLFGIKLIHTLASERGAVNTIWASFCTNTQISAGKRQKPQTGSGRRNMARCRKNRERGKMIAICAEIQGGL